MGFSTDTMGKFNASLSTFEAIKSGYSEWSAMLSRFKSSRDLQKKCNCTTQGAEVAGTTEEATYVA